MWPVTIVSFFKNCDKILIILPASQFLSVWLSDPKYIHTVV